MSACILCGADRTDRYGTLRHEGCCPMFMRGPDPGGDPYEWPTLFEPRVWETTMLDGTTTQDVYLTAVKREDA